VSAVFFPSQGKRELTPFRPVANPGMRFGFVFAADLYWRQSMKNLMFALSLTLLVAADKPADDAGKKDLHKLQGSWRCLVRDERREDAQGATRENVNHV